MRTTPGGKMIRSPGSPIWTRTSRRWPAEWKAPSPTSNGKRSASSWIASVANSTGGAAIQRLLNRRRPDLRARLSHAAAEGDWPAGLGLIGALSGWIALGEWPAEEVAALLALARRRLRDPRSLADPAVWAVPDFILRITPDDLEAGRLAGRNRLRQRRLREAVRLYGAVVAIDPHAARDWIDLASAHDRLGEGPERDACLARAVVIDPASLTAPLSEAFWARMAAA